MQIFVKYSRYSPQICIQFVSVPVFFAKANELPTDPNWIADLNKGCAKLTMTQELYKNISNQHRWLITFVIMAATLMQVIDTTIVNVALPHIQGSLGASSDEITWMLTSYLISSAIFMPLTGFFSDNVGRKKFLIIAIIGFTFSSALCGAATTLTQMVIFRFLQGVFGASLAPISQAILSDIFPPNERGKAMAIWSMGIMIGPILGPSLGGYLTEVLSWHWIFYVNIPVGIFTLLLSNVLPDSPLKQRAMDWKGIILLSLAIGGLQFVLDRGNIDDWFNSNSICLISYIAFVSFLGFIYHSLQKNAVHVFDITIFRDKNFTLASVLLCTFGLGLYGMMVIQPIMMETLLNYPTTTTGYFIVPRGVSAMISTIVVGKFVSLIEPRKIIITGLLLTASGIAIGTHYSTTYISPIWIVGPLFLQGFGLGMIFVPLSTVAFSTLPGSQRTEAAGLFSLLRTIGSSIGISLVITIYTRRTQFFWNQLSGYINPYNTNLSHFLTPLHLHPQQPLGTTILGNILFQQASMLSYVNVFAFIMWCFILMIPLALFLKYRKI